MRGAASDPRPIRVNAVKIDLKTANVGFTGTGRAPGNVYGTPLDEAKTHADGDGANNLQLGTVPVTVTDTVT